MTELLNEIYNDDIDDFVANVVAAATAEALKKTAPSTSAPLYTVELGPVTMTVIQVNLNFRDYFQIYAVSDESWALTGSFGLFVDALAELRVWRSFIAQGGSLRQWQTVHPGGIRPGHSAAVAR